MEFWDDADLAAWLFRVGHSFCCQAPILKFVKNERRLRRFCPRKEIPLRLRPLDHGEVLHVFAEMGLK